MGLYEFASYRQNTIKSVCLKDIIVMVNADASLCHFSLIWWPPAALESTKFGALQLCFQGHVTMRRYCFWMACYNVMGRIKLVRRMKNAVWTSSRFLFCYRLLLSAWLKMLNLFIPLRWLQCFRGVCQRVLPLPSLSFHRSPVYTLVCACAAERGFVF